MSKSTSKKIRERLGETPAEMDALAELLEPASIASSGSGGLGSEGRE